MKPALCILSPKRNMRFQTGWEGFFPYYAGFPELFARELLQSANLPRDAVILDPWNGSGTTTYAASALGMTSMGIDLNPVMIVIARARLLPPSEADHLEPLAAAIVDQTQADTLATDSDDPLLVWFHPATAAFIRGIERNLRRSLVGGKTRTPDRVHLDKISGTAATLYVALFSACRKFVAPFRSSNPTWLRKPGEGEARLRVAPMAIVREFTINVEGMAAALCAKLDSNMLRANTLHAGETAISLADTTSMQLGSATVDFVLTSPPYCTRLDYTAATRIELAVLAPLLETSIRDLGRQMIGTTQVPAGTIEVQPGWGRTCARFLDALHRHPSKASDGYYYVTHLDYFDKMARSMGRLATALKPAGRAVFVVQDSHYKDLHNNLPKIISEMGVQHGLKVAQRKDFYLGSMSDINPGRKSYVRPAGATESVLCFTK